MKISVVIPVYNCCQSINELYNRLTDSLITIVDKYEIIFIDDGSECESWALIQSIANVDPSVVGLKFSRNYGQHAAINAGLSESSGEWVVVMDCDLQDQPEEIINLYRALEKGVDAVFAQRVNRKDSFVKKVTSVAFYRLLSYLTDTKLDPLVANFGIYNRKVIDAILAMKESHKYFPVMVRWVGFTTISIPVVHDDRKTGVTTYTYRSLIRLAVDIILAFSTKPLRLIVKLGFLISFFSALYALFIVADALISGTSVVGWSSIMASIWFNSGILIAFVGVVGLYVGKTFDQVKSRPTYIVEDRV